MENIVYILGAGFSQPMGLPVMENFIDEAKYLARTNSRYSYIEKLLNDLRKQQSVIGDYFDYKRFNIEEALSVLEMQENLEQSGETLNSLKKDFTKCIIDVIVNKTAEMPNRYAMSDYIQGWKEVIFGEDEKLKWYIFFVANLFQITLSQFRDYNRELLRLEVEQNPKIRYSIISLNYDLILEKLSKFIDEITPNKKIEIKFCNESDSQSPCPKIAKLHGSVDKGEIIPPTFLKGLYNQKLPDSWKLAYDLLINANQIRIIGYSLPESDSYIKYMLKASVGQQLNLNRIDILCKDQNGEVEKRYRSFIHENFHHKLKFRNSTTENYLGHNYQLRTIDTDSKKLKFDKLERAHLEFFDKNR